MGPSSGALGALLRPSWSPWEASWGHHGGHRAKKGGNVGARKVASWGPFGALLRLPWGRIGALLGPSWGPLGPGWSHREASRAHRKRNGEKANNLETHKVLDGIGPLGGVLGRLCGHVELPWNGLGAVWRHVGSYLESSRALLSDLGGHLGLITWGPFGAMLGHHRRSTPLDGGAQTWGEGGAGPPSPKGKWGVGTTSSLNHLTPKGLVGLSTQTAFVPSADNCVVSSSSCRGRRWGQIRSQGALPPPWPSGTPPPRSPPSPAPWNREGATTPSSDNWLSPPRVARRRFFPPELEN